MKRLLPLVLSAGIVFGPAGVSPAEEPPYREFVQALRDRGEPDLALQYLNQLRQQKLPADFAAVLPLEMARTHVAMAEQGGTANKKLANYEQAQADLQTFLKSKPTPTLKAEAQFDMARLQRLQGQARMLQAAQEEGADAQQSFRLRARTDFEGAAQSLAQAARDLTDQLTKLDNQDTSARRLLANEKRRAEFESGLNLFDDLETFGDNAEETNKRGEMAQKAITIFQQVAKEDPDGLIGWKAKAWLIRCYQEVDNAGEADKAYRRILRARRHPAPVEVMRLARYFMIRGIPRDPNRKGNRLVAIVDECHKWLEEYPGDTRTPEGQGVRFFLADALRQELAELSAAQQRAGRGRAMYREARRLYRALASREGPYTQKAREGKIQLLVQHFADQGNIPVTNLHTFEECYIRAEVEMYRLGEESKKLSGDKAKQKREERLQTATEALQRANDFVNAQTPTDDRIDAQQLLAFVYLTAGRPYEAAVQGEYVAESNPKSRHAAIAGSYALQAYAQVIGADETGQKPDDVLEADRTRLRDLARYMVKTWPDEPVTDVARHQLADLAMHDKDYAQAIQYLNGIRPTYGAYTAALFDLSTAALLAEREKRKLPPGQPSWRSQAMTALQHVREPTGGMHSQDLYYYFNAKLRLGNLLFQERKYDEMARLAEQLNQRFKGTTLVLDAKSHADLEPAIQSLPYFAKYGEADKAFHAKKYAEAEKALAPFIEQIKKPAPDLKAPALLRKALGLALLTDLQLKKVEPARAILESLLQKKAGGDDDDTTAILSGLVQEMGTQIEDLRHKLGPASAEVQQTTQTYVEFLDQMRKKWIVPNQNPSPQRLRFLALGYTRLGAHDRAADLLEQVPKPDLSNDHDPQKRATENQEREAYYHAIRLALCRELRLAKEYDKAQDVLKDILATPIGKRSLETRWEKLLLQQDQGQYFQSAKGWYQLMSDLKSRINDPKTQEQYFECYYNFVYSYYKHATGMTDTAKRKSAVRRAANFIVQLERKRPDMGGSDLKKRYNALLEGEAELKEQYDALK